MDIQASGRYPTGSPLHSSVEGSAEGPIERLVDGRRIWWARGTQEAGARVLAGGTGYPALDAALPGGGWPAAALTEILSAGPGGGALSLVMPALARLTAAGGWIGWVAPPHTPYAPALEAAGLRPDRQLLVEAADDGAALWAMEQALRSGGCAAVLAWADTRLPGAETTALRRLQLAAGAGGSWALLFRPLAAEARPSPAVLRLEAAPGRVRILKCRGGRPRWLRLQP